MRWVFTFIIVVHGLIHLMGPAKAFGYAELPQLTQPISRGMGLVWLLAALLCLAAVAAFFAWPRGWWMIGAAALVVSQAVIFSSWSDAKFGTLANILLLAGVAYGYFTQAAHTISATLFFDDDGLLKDFVSNDRLASNDGREYKRWPWSTPIAEYRAYGPYRLAARGEARWHPPEGEYVYAAIDILDVEYNRREP